MCGAISVRDLLRQRNHRARNSGLRQDQNQIGQKKNQRSKKHQVIAARDTFQSRFALGERNEEPGRIAAARDGDQYVSGRTKRREKTVGGGLRRLCDGGARNQQASRFSSLATLVTTALEAFG